MLRTRFSIRQLLICMAFGQIVFAQAPAGPAPAHRDLPYKTWAKLTEYERSRCKLDLYLPEGHSFPVLVWFHGGGLTGGTKDTEARLGAHFASQGIAVAMVNYRLSPKVRYPEYVRDAAAAVVWVKRHIAQYGGRPEALFVGGHSAGGYLTMALGMDPSHFKAVGGPSVHLAGLIPVSGQMATHYTIRAERQDKGLGMRVDEAAPLNHVRPGLPPILNICAEHDDWKRLMENRTLEAYFKAEGIRDTELHIMADRDHGSIIECMMSPNDPAFLLIQAFIAKHASAAAEGTPH